jgi:pimeloyl-ACP methyl ester carboxylesterase
VKSTLFLHMGPGLNAYVERQLMQDQRPEVYFWDQPPVEGPTAYEQLIEAAITVVDEMQKAAAKPIHLLAHSFGGHLAKEILYQRPMSVASCDFFSTGFDPAQGFHHLLMKLQHDSQTSVAVKRKMADVLSRHPSASAENVWEIIAQILEEPDFMRLYWPTVQQYERYKKISSGGPAFQATTFEDVLKGFFRRPARSGPHPWKGPLALFLGAGDPLISVPEDSACWRQLFPGLTLAVVPDSGHYPHLKPYFG